eukprot:scaffold27981_cov37-Cyclotella_meneghiniana.AAC.17
MAGFLTSERYYGATTIVDHVTDYVYVHLMRNLTLEEIRLKQKDHGKRFFMMPVTSLSIIRQIMVGLQIRDFRMIVLLTTKQLATVELEHIIKTE